MQTTNIDTAEVAKFNAAPHQWWDTRGDFATLHHINPLRLNWIQAQVAQHSGTGLAGKAVLDIGCGGGILAESMAKADAVVTGIDMADAALQIARLHALEQNIAATQLQYLCSTAEDFAASHAAQFDVVSCMEMLEHVPDPAAVVQAAARLLKPGGVLCLSTLNRGLMTFLGAIVAAEHLLRIVPKGTHHYEKCITPAELSAMVRGAGLTVRNIQGMGYNPMTQLPFLEKTPRINYFLSAVKV